MTITMALAPITNIVATPGGVSAYVFPIFSFLVLPLMCAASFLPAWWIFVVAAVNCLFTLCALFLLPRNLELTVMLKTAAASILTPFLLSQVVVSIVAYLWVRNAIQALRRADRAEEIAKLEHDLASNAEIAVKQKSQLEVSIQKVIETHTRVANGDITARVPLTEDNVLWQISGSLNNLLSRFQRMRQEVSELQQVKFALQQAREENIRLRSKLEHGL